MRIMMGRIAYLHGSSGAEWGQEDWRIAVAASGERTLSAHCLLELNDERVVRTSIQSVDADYQPIEAYVRIERNGRLTGSGWFRFGLDTAECEAWDAERGRRSEAAPIIRPMRGFGTHALAADAWMAATWPSAIGVGARHFWGENLIHSDHHFGATGPTLARTGSGLEYAGDEELTVPAGRFACRRFRFVGFTNDHPPYDFWITADGDALFVRGEVGGYIDARFELTRLASC